MILADDGPGESCEDNNSGGEREPHGNIEESRASRARSMSFEAQKRGLFNLLPHSPRGQMPPFSKTASVRYHGLGACHMRKHYVPIPSKID